MSLWFRPWVVLPLLWLLCTVLNVDKAVHIDDTAHLEIAEAIRQSPLHAMSSTVYWSRGVGPIHHLNQPHLFFYLLALTLSLPGPVLLWAHLLVAGILGAGIVLMYRCARAVGLEEPWAVLSCALIFAGPALLPSQNVMTDVPLLAMWLWFFLALLRAQRDPRTGWLWTASAVCGAACLVKYTSLALVPVLALEVYRHERRPWAVLSAAGAVLAGWSAFNLYDYGGVHLLGRKVENAQLQLGVAAAASAGRSLIWLIALGGVAPFSALFADRIGRRFATRQVIAYALAFGFVCVVGAQLVPSFGVEEFHEETLVHSVLRVLFFFNGLVLLWLSISMRQQHVGGERARVVDLLLAWAGCTSLFIVALSPFVAVRHALLCLPPLLMLPLLDARSRPGPRTVAGVTAVTVLLGVAVATADWRFADVYRTRVEQLRAELSGERRVLFVGHWGLQWYAKKAGFEHYVPSETRLTSGDVLIRPHVVDQPPVAEEDEARLVLDRTVTVPASVLDTFRTVTDVGGFYSIWQGLPWTISTEPLESFEVLRVR